MSLAEIKNKLYSKDADKDLSKHDLNEFDIRAALEKKQADAGVEDKWGENDKDELGTEKKKLIKIGTRVAIGIVVLAVLVFGIVKFMQSAFSEKNVIIKIDGPTDAASGKLLTFSINYTNDNRATLKNAILRVTYPESFKPGENTNFTSESQTSGVFKLGDVPGKSSSKIIFNGNAYSPQGTLMYLKIDLVYTPSNFNSQFDTTNQLGVSVSSSPIDFEIMAPQKISGGDSIDYQIKYTNTGKESFDHIKVKVDYPDGFTYSHSDPAVSESNNVWYIGTLAAGQSGKIVASGKLTGNRDEVKNAKAYIGTDYQGQFASYSEEQTSTTITISPIEIAQSVNGSASYLAKSGDVLRFRILYKNNGNIDLRDIILTEKIDSPVVDYSSLQLEKGSFDSNSKTITWKGVDDATLKNLAPGQTGEIDFSVKIKDVIPVSTANDKNFIVSAIAKMDSQDIQTPINSNKVVSGNTLDIKLDSKLVLDMKGYYGDTAIPNSGPIPPKVGSPTTYTIHWRAFNISNDITGAKVTASLPTGVTMTGKILPDDGALTYNSRDNSLVWDIGNLPANTGILNAPKEVVFQIQITPAANQFDTLVPLVGAATFTAKDTFTGDAVSAVTDPKNTGLMEDPSIGTKYKVVN
jgi:hypothetical protein